MGRLKLTFIIFILLSAGAAYVTPEAAAQAPGTAWGTASLGGNEDFLGVSFTLARARASAPRAVGRTIMGRVVAMEEFCLFGCSRPSRHVEVGAMLGATTGSRHVTLTLAAGGALIFGRPTDDGSGSNEAFTTVGMPLVAEVGIRPFRMVGLSVAGSVTASPEGAVPLVLVGLQFGALHPR